MSRSNRFLVVTIMLMFSVTGFAADKPKKDDSSDHMMDMKNSKATGHMGMSQGGMTGNGNMAPGMMGNRGMMMGGGMMGYRGMMRGGMMGMMHGGMMGGYGMMSMRHFSKKDRPKVRKIFSSLRKKNWKLMGQMMDQREKLGELYDADKINKGAILNVYSEMFKLKRKMIEAHLDAMLKLKKFKFTRPMYMTN